MSLNDVYTDKYKHIKTISYDKNNNDCNNVFKEFNVSADTISGVRKHELYNLDLTKVIFTQGVSIEDCDNMCNISGITLTNPESFTHFKNCRSLKKISFAEPRYTQRNCYVNVHNCNIHDFESLNLGSFTHDLRLSGLHIAYFPQEVYKTSLCSLVMDCLNLKSFSNINNIDVSDTMHLVRVNCIKNIINTIFNNAHIFNISCVAYNDPLKNNLLDNIITQFANLTKQIRKNYVMDLFIALEANGFVAGCEL